MASQGLIARDRPGRGAGDQRAVRIATVVTAAVTSVVCVVAPVAGLVALVVVAFAAVLIWSFPVAMLTFVFLEQTLANVFLVKRELFVLLLLSWGVWRLAGRGQPRSFDFVDYAVLLYGLWCAVSLFRALDFSVGFEHFSSVTVGLVFFGLFSRNVSSHLYLAAMLGTIAAAGLLMGLLGYYQFATGTAFVTTLGSQANVTAVDQYIIGSMVDVNRVNSTTFDPQDYAMYMQTAILCTIALLPIVRRRAHRVLLVIALAILVGGWVLSFSRRSILCLALALGLFVLRRPAMLWPVALAGVAALGVTGAASGLLQRLSEIGVIWNVDVSPIDAAVHAYRMAEWRRAWEVFLESPLFGKGMTNYAFYAVSSQAAYLTSSRDFSGVLLHLAEHGLLASLLLVGIFGVTIARGFALSRWLDRQDRRTFGWLVYGATVALVGLLSAAFISEQAYYYFVVWVLAGGVHGAAGLVGEWPRAAATAPQSGQRVLAG